MELACMPFWSKRRQEVTVNFTSSGTWDAPLTTSSVSTVYGQGGTGAAAVPPSYGTGSALVANMDYIQTTATGNTAGNPTWFGFNQALANAVSGINSQASSSSAAPTYTAYSGTTYYNTGTTVYTNNQYYNGGQVVGFSGVTPGTVTGRTVGTGGSSGSPVVGGSNYSTQGYVDFQYLVPGTGTPSTTGASSTALGFTFVGGTGGAGSPSTQGPVSVTPGASYPIVVGAGGFVTLTYYQ